MTVENDYSKYANIANSTKTVEINGERVGIKVQSNNSEEWALLSELHSQVNAGDTFFCTDGKDDGNITNKEKTCHFANGMWNSTKDKAIPTIAAAGAAVGIKAVAGTAIGSAIAGTTVGAAVIAAAPVVLGVAAVVGGAYLAIKGISTIIQSSQDAKNAQTDAEAKAAWSQMGYSTTDVAVGTATAVVGAKSLKKTIPEAKKNPELQELGNKAKGIGTKIKNFFSKIFKKGKKATTNTGTQTNTPLQNEPLRLEAPKNGATGANTATNTGETPPTNGATQSTPKNNNANNTGNTNNGSTPLLGDGNSTGSLNASGVSYTDATNTASELLEQLSKNPTDKSLYNKIMKLVHPDLWANATEEEIAVIQYLASKANTIYQ